MNVVTLGRWGKNLALRVPDEIARQLRLRKGERLEIEAGPDQLVIRRAKPRYTLEEMFAGKTPAEWRALYAGAYDWGADVGREIVKG